MSQKRDFAKQLRRDMTDAEKFLWNQVRGRRLAGFKFRRQVPLRALQGQPEADGEEGKKARQD